MLALQTLPVRAAVHLLRHTTSFRGRWRVERWLAQHPQELLQLPPRVMPVTGDQRLLVEAFNNRDMYVQPSARDKDELVLQVFEAVLRPGDHVLDIGANIGRMSLLASRLVGPQGRVLAYEPSPVVVASLYKNIFFNRCENIAVRNYAVSDADGVLSFHMPLDTNSGLGSFRDIDTGDSLTIEVPIHQLDGESGLPEALRLMKIDTEGADIRVLRGAQALIRRCRPVIVMEFSPRWIAQLGDSPDWLAGFMAEQGYSLYRLRPGGPERLEQLPTEQIDLLCTPVALQEESWAALRRVG